MGSLEILFSSSSSKMGQMQKYWREKGEEKKGAGGKEGKTVEM